MERQFFQYLKYATRGEKSAVDDFAAYISRMLDYDEPDRVIYQYKELSFVMCGQRVDAKPDVCVKTLTDFLILVQDEVYSSDPEAQLITEAIAAFYQNILGRTSSRRSSLASKVFLGITMIGAVPFFYRIPVTAELVRCIETAAYPSQATIAQRFIPPVPDQALYMEDGLVSFENQRIVMQRFEAFKALTAD
ncbi:hypothetical protein EDD85DRAFT_88307 [Armillaria nabsnona]|nr:hypothetical protein EDD85DRAFT_88307 [Armillaria nabsnona]